MFSREVLTMRQLFNGRACVFNEVVGLTHFAELRMRAPFGHDTSRFGNRIHKSIGDQL
jgi:hypothetical protein